MNDLNRSKEQFHIETSYIKNPKYTNFERENKRIGKGLAIQAIYKSIYQRIYRNTPTETMIRLESRADELEAEHSAKALAITLNPKPTITTSPHLWAKFITWVEQLPERKYFKSKSLVYQIEQRPNKGPESRHIHLYIELAYNRAPSTIQQALGQNQYFGNYKHIHVEKVTNKNGWINYCKKNILHNNKCPPNESLHKEVQLETKPVDFDEEESPLFPANKRQLSRK